LQAFQQLCERLQRPPTISELSAALGLSEKGAQQPLNLLIEDGLIVAKTRTIRKPQRISAAGIRWLAQAKKEKGTK